MEESMTFVCPLCNAPVGIGKGFTHDCPEAPPAKEERGKRMSEECADCKQLGANVTHWMQETFKWNKLSQEDRAKLAAAEAQLKVAREALSQMKQLCPDAGAMLNLAKLALAAMNQKSTTEDKE